MSVREGQARLKKIAGQISEDTHLNSEDKEFLVKALMKISNGEDAETALAVKAKKGERKSKNAKSIEWSKELLFSWIATATAPESEGGLGFSLKDAVSIAKEKGWPNVPSEQSLRRQWNDVRKDQGRVFKFRTD